MKKKILLIEDSDSIRKTTKMILTLHGGYEVYDYATAEEALDFLSKLDCNLLISDITLPKMDGFQLIETIKQNEKFKNLPVLVITGNYNILELQNLSSKNKIDGWLSKPFDQNVLMLLVKQYLSV